MKLNSIYSFNEYKSEAGRKKEMHKSNKNMKEMGE
jgi:hypothetical protein